MMLAPTRELVAELDHRARPTGREAPQPAATSSWLMGLGQRRRCDVIIPAATPAGSAFRAWCRRRASMADRVRVRVDSIAWVAATGVLA
jgi:hypothetical protein